MRAPRLAALELRRFGRGRLPRAAMVAMLLLPLLYGALYLWSFWDPYERLDRIPVALVNEDRGAKAGGEHLDAGDSLVERLRDSDTFDWRETDAADARAGVADGRYYLSLTVPRDFSKRLASSSGDDPQTSALRVRTNDAGNYLVGQISRSVFSEVRAAASSKASRRFYNRIYLSFSTLHDETERAAKGADRLEDGIGKARKGADDLATGLDEAEDGSGRLKDGTAELHRGSAKLKKGAAAVASGTRKLADKVHRLADRAGPVLDRDGDDIGKAARRVARTSKTLKENLDGLPAAAGQAETDSRRAADALDTLYRAQCEGVLKLPAGCPELKKARDAAERSAGVAEDLNKLVEDHRDTDELADRLDDLRRAADALAERAPHLDEDLASAVAKVDRLNKGAQQVSRGAGKLHTGLGGAKSGAAALDTGLGKLSGGADTLYGGMFRLADGSQKLAGGLHEGAGKIPDYGTEERRDRTGVMADPVGLSSSALHSAPNYGTGFAPYFIPLSLWIGAMVAYMLLQPLNRRALAAGAPAWRIALAGWLPVAAIGAAQATALLAVLQWGLGLQPARGAGTAGFVLLVTACFTALVQFLNARFGPAGRILVLALLMLQLTSAGGTYPVETSPGFFEALHPFLPMTYVVEGLRHLITGGELWPVWRACAVLAAFTAGALALTALSARRRQMWTLDRLHPEISL